MSVGVSFEHSPFFHISVQESTLATLLDDICDSLHTQGVGNIFVINGHYGNRGALSVFMSGRQSGPAVHAPLVLAVHKVKV